MSEPEAISIERADGIHTTIRPDQNLQGPDGEPLALSDVRDVLSRPDGWIDYETEARWEPVGYEEGERWKSGEPTEWRSSRCRIYARAVVGVTEIKPEPA